MGRCPLVTTRLQQYQLGLQTIHGALEAALIGAGVHGYAISHTTQGSVPRDTTFAVVAMGRSAEQPFTREEIADSAHTIDSFAVTKVRLLVRKIAAG